MARTKEFLSKKEIRERVRAIAELLPETRSWILNAINSNGCFSRDRARCLEQEIIEANDTVAFRLAHQGYSAEQLIRDYKKGHGVEDHTTIYLILRKAHLPMVRAALNPLSATQINEVIAAPSCCSGDTTQGLLERNPELKTVVEKICVQAGKKNNENAKMVL